MSNRLPVTVYVMTAAILSAVSVTFEWVSPIDTPEGAWDWYREVGVRNGLLVVAQHEPPGGGWRLDLDWPRFPPFPFFAGAGPDSGGLYIATWFAVGLVATVHVFRRRRRAVACNNTGGRDG